MMQQHTETNTETIGAYLEEKIRKKFEKTDEKAQIKKVLFAIKCYYFLFLLSIHFAQST